MDLTINVILLIIGAVIGKSNGFSMLFKILLSMSASYLPLSIQYQELKLWDIDMLSNENMYQFLKTEICWFGLFYTALILFIFYSLLPRLWKYLFPRKMEKKIEQIHKEMSELDKTTVENKVRIWYKKILSLIFTISPPKKQVNKKDWDMTYTEIEHILTNIFSSIILILLVCIATLRFPMLIVLSIGVVLLFVYIVILAILPTYRYYSNWISKMYVSENNKRIKK